MNILSKAIVIVLLIVLFMRSFRYSAFNTQPVKACMDKIKECTSFNVHTAHDDKKEAAELLRKVTEKNEILMDHLRKKYLIEYQTVNPSNQMNVIGGVENQLLAERVDQLLHNYSSDNIYEISPLNVMGQTSYTENKKNLVFCLRSKNEGNDLHDINTVMFVVIHELSHMMNDKWGHEDEFWKLFKFMLQEAVECGVYKNINYFQSPVMYCGLEIAYSPLYDSSL